MKNFVKIALAGASALCLGLGFVACSDDEPKPTVESPLSFIDRADVPDALSGFSYDLSALVKTEDHGYTLSATAYTKDGDTKTPVSVSGTKFTPTKANDYVYAVVTATKDGTSVQTEEIAIRVMEGVLEENFRFAAYRGEEYDLHNALYDNEYANLSAVAYYLDGNAKTEIAVTDMKVTIDNPAFNCFYVEYTVGAATSDPVKIQIEGERDPIEAGLWNTWGHGQKNFNYDRTYIKEGSTSLRFDSGSLYDEANDSYNRGYRVVGSLLSYNLLYSVTDWSNAVFTVKIYNAEMYDLTASLQVRHAASSTNIDYGGITFTLAPGWNTCEYSFRANGITTAPYYDSELDYGSGITTGAKNDGFALGIKPTTDMKDFTVYVDGLDIADYSAEKFPDVNVLLPGEIAQNKYDSLTGDSHDRLTVVNTLEDSIKLSKWYYTTTSPEIVSYAEGADGGMNIANRPKELADSTTLVKQTIRGTGNESNIASVPVWFDNQKEVGLLDSYLTSLGDLDWSKAAISMYVYNGTGFNSNAYLMYGYTHYAETGGVQPKVAGIVSLPKDKWTKVDFSLASLNIDPAGDYVFGIAINSWQSGAVTPSAEFTYYVDGLQIYEKVPMDMASYGANYEREKSVDPAYDKDGDGVSYKYTFTHGFAANNADGIVNGNRGRFFHYTAWVGNDQLFGLTENTDWSNLYCKIYIKQEKVLTDAHINLLLRIQTSKDGGVSYQGTSEMIFSAYHKNHDFANNTEWQEWEFSIADFISAGLISEDFGGEGVTHYRISLNTECTKDVTFYVDGLSLYNKAA